MLGNKLNVLVQMAFDRSPELPDVPSALDLVSDPAARQVLELILRRQEMGRPLAAPPGHALGHPSEQLNRLMLDPAPM